MWIRSQNRKDLINIDNIYALKIIHGSYGWVSIDACTEDAHYTIGKYSTEKRGFKILDKISKMHIEPIMTKNGANDEVMIYKNKIFQMPEK